MKRKQTVGLRYAIWNADDPLAGEDRQRGPSHGTVGPATRGFACDGQCWDPNRYGMCRTCGGFDPRRAKRVA